VSNPRAEVVFTIAGEEYRRRPTFGVIAAIERGHGAIMPLLHRALAKGVGIGETAQITHTILGGKEKGAPKLSVVQEEVFENYARALGRVADFLAEAVTDPNADTGDGEADGEGDEGN